MKRISERWNTKRILPVAGLLVVGLFLGWLFFAGPGGSDTPAGGHDHASEESTTIWTCSMHPQIRQDEPGQCPICGMDLIPMDEGTSSDTPARLQMTEEAVQAANVHTVEVTKGMPFREVRLSGKIQPDETHLAEITARYPGRIEDLYINITGQRVGRGDRLASIYSPELIAAQKELLEAASMEGSHPSYLEAARGKLRYWDLSDEQIRAIENSGEVRRTFDILSPQGGTVLERQIAEGDYVREGQSLFEIADLSRVWVMFDAYETDLVWIREGMTVRFTVAGQQGREFSGRISFIDPVIDPMSRVARVRVEMPNPNRALKPEMFATGVVKATLSGDENRIIVPKTSVLWTGKRSVVWVRDMQAEVPVFEYRQVRLGPEAGDGYVIEEGLMEGEHIVVNGVFSIDAAAQLQGKTSMMSPSGGPAPKGHDHGAMSGGAADDMQTPVTAVSARFQAQLYDMFRAYEKISKAMIASDPSTVPDAVAATSQALGKVDGSLLSGEMRAHWAEMHQELRKSLKALRGTRDIEKQRGFYSGISNTLYEALKHFGVEGDAVYRQFCPMAFDDQGAYWLSSQKEIRNPYFGQKMIKCGVTKETL